MNKKRFEYLYNMCVASIGIPLRGKVDFGDKVPIDPIRKIYYTNSIEEYRYLLSLANKSRSRTGLAKKIRSAETAVKFLQYAKDQTEFMNFLSMRDQITFNRIPIYSNPSILKSIIPTKGDIAIPVDPKAKV